METIFSLVRESNKKWFHAQISQANEVSKGKSEVMGFSMLCSQGDVLKGGGERGVRVEGENDRLGKKK